jgi:hypothetical protein
MSGRVPIGPPRNLAAASVKSVSPFDALGVVGGESGIDPCSARAAVEGYGQQLANALGF